MVEEKNQIKISFLRFSLWQWITMVVVLVVVGIMTFNNLQIAAQRARDWERKENLKKIGNILIQSYRIDNQGLPPHSPDWRIVGCESTLCSVGDEQEPACNWNSVLQPGRWYCGQHIYMNPLPMAPDNKQTVGADAPKYRRVSGTEVVLEICLEDQEDAEGEPVSQSKIGWTDAECPSGYMYQWPDEDE